MYSTYIHKQDGVKWYLRQMTEQDLFSDPTLVSFTDELFNGDVNNYLISDVIVAKTQERYIIHVSDLDGVFDKAENDDECARLNDKLRQATGLNTPPYTPYKHKETGEIWNFRKPTKAELDSKMKVITIYGIWFTIDDSVLISSKYHKQTNFRFAVHKFDLLEIFEVFSFEYEPVENPAKDIQIDESPKFVAVEQYDYINPSHYQNSGKEVWEMMVDVWGVEAFIKHCEMCAFKYRMRLGLKPEQPIERDLSKAEWYESKAKELRAQLPKSKIAAAGDLGQLKIKIS
jgi:hypothetical protein